MVFSPGEIFWLQGGFISVLIYASQIHKAGLLL